MRAAAERGLHPGWRSGLSAAGSRVHRGGSGQRPGGRRERAAPEAGARSVPYRALGTSTGPRPPPPPPPWPASTSPPYFSSIPGIRSRRRRRRRYPRGGISSCLSALRNSGRGRVTPPWQRPRQVPAGQTAAAGAAIPGSQARVRRD